MTKTARHVCHLVLVLSLSLGFCKGAQRTLPSNRHLNEPHLQPDVAEEERDVPAVSDGVYFHAYRPEIFHDTRVLPDDREVAVFVFSDEPKRYFYIVEREHGPFSLTVTPCAEEIEWRLSLVVSGSDTDDGHREAGKHDYIGSPPKLALVTSYEGKERYTYTSLTAPAGTYVFDITSRGRDTNVRIYATVDPQGRFPYPVIPRNSRVNILKVRENRVLISWPARPPSESQQPVEFCVVANPKSNFHTHCGLLTELHGDIPQPPPSTVGFGFLGEKQHRKKILNKIHQMRSSLKKRHDVVYECVGRRTWHIIKGLERGKSYYLDVFAINTETNYSTNYPGAKVTLPMTDPGVALKENILTPLVLDESNGYKVKANYDLHMPAQALWFFVQSCTGPGPLRVGISNDLHDILSAHVMDLKTLKVQEPLNGSYTVTISSDVEVTRSAAVLVSRKHHKYPYPVLPDDKRIKVFVTLTTCDSVTLAWFTTQEEKVRYCIYKRTERDGSARMFDKPPNICKDPNYEKDTRRQKVLCRRYHKFSRRRFNNVIMQKIRGLEPGTTYVFEVHVTKFRGKSLPYEEVWVTTANKCTHDRVLS